MKTFFRTFFFASFLMITVNCGTSVKVTETYHLETVAYDLESERNKQLIAAVTVDITDPKSAAEVAPKYADKVFAQFE